MDDDVRHRLEAVCERLHARLGDDLLGVALFGSQARGDARPDSDLDILVLARGLDPTPAKRYVSLSPLPLPSGPAVSLMLLTPEEFLADVRPIDLDIALDARALFERDAFLTTHLGRLRQLIEEAGLYRTPRLFWRWKTPPARDWAITWEGVRR